MKKLEKEQLPKAIALGVLATGVLSYAGYTWLGRGDGEAPAAATAAHPDPSPGGSPTKGGSTQAAAEVSAVMPLVPVDNPDPFRPALGQEGGTPKPAPASQPAARAEKPAGAPKPEKPGPFHPSGGAPQLADVLTGPAMDGLPGVAAPPGSPHSAGGAAAGPKPLKLADASSALAGGPGKPFPGGAGGASGPAGGSPHAPAGAGPTGAQTGPPSGGGAPPPVVVTGILEGQENVAILRWSDTQRQVVRVGDQLDGGYTVKAIRPDGVVLAHGASQWLARLGADRPAAN